MADRYLDMDGQLVEVGDTVESPGRASDPITGKIAVMWVEWPDGEAMGLIRCENYDGQGGVTVRIGSSLKCPPRHDLQESSSVRSCGTTAGDLMGPPAV